MVWVGYVAIAVAVIWLLVKLYASYDSAGGTVMVVVYDAALYPPIIGVVGLYFVLSEHQIYLALWMYLVIWAVTTALAAGALRLIEEFGDKPL